MLIPVLWLWMKDNQDEKYHFCQYFSLQTLDKCLKILKHCSRDVPWPGIYTFYWTISKKLKSDFHRSMLFCKHVSLDFVSIFCSCRICAWSLKFYTNQAYSIHVREQKVGSDHRVTDWNAWIRWWIFIKEWFSLYLQRLPFFWSASLSVEWQNVSVMSF